MAKPRSLWKMLRWAFARPRPVRSGRPLCLEGLEPRLTPSSTSLDNVSVLVPPDASADQSGVVLTLSQGEQNTSTVCQDVAQACRAVPDSIKPVQFSLVVVQVNLSQLNSLLASGLKLSQSSDGLVEVGRLPGNTLSQLLASGLTWDNSDPRRPNSAGQNGLGLVVVDTGSGMYAAIRGGMMGMMSPPESLYGAVLASLREDRADQNYAEAEKGLGDPGSLESDMRSGGLFGAPFGDLSSMMKDRFGSQDLSGALRLLTEERTTAEADSDKPIVLADSGSISLATELPPNRTEVQTDGLPGSDLILVPAVVPGLLGEQEADGPVEVAASDPLPSLDLPWLALQHGPGAGRNPIVQPGQEARRREERQAKPVDRDNSLVSASAFGLRSLWNRFLRHCPLPTASTAEKIVEPAIGSEQVPADSEGAAGEAETRPADAASGRAGEPPVEEHGHDPHGFPPMLDGLKTWLPEQAHEQENHAALVLLPALLAACFGDEKAKRGPGRVD